MGTGMPLHKPRPIPDPDEHQDEIPLDSRPFRESQASSRTIAVIGGGFSGTMVAAQLLRSGADASLRIILIERRDRVGAGIAYQTDRWTDLLNVPAAKMSALPDEPTHFLQWLRATGREVQPTAFVPRRFYGEYIRATLNSAVKSSPHRQLTILQDAVQSARQSVARGDQWEIGLASGGFLRADAVVLATGHDAQRQVTHFPNEICRSDRYIGNPWDADSISTIDTDDRVLLIGTGLTMVDTVIALHRQGHRRPVAAVSRRGLTARPHVLRDENAKPYRFPEEFADREWPLRDLVRLIRREAITARECGGSWHEVIDALRPHTQRLWTQLTNKDRRRFLTHLLPYWDAHRHRCAIEAGAAIRMLQDQKYLSVRTGRIQRIDIDDRELLVELQPRGWDRAVTERFDRIICCAGAELDPRRSNSPLLMQLLAEGIVHADSLGIGLRCTERGEAIAENEQPRANFFVIGPFRRADLWESTAVPELRFQASAIAQSLINFFKEEAVQ